MVVFIHPDINREFNPEIDIQHWAINGFAVDENEREPERVSVEMNDLSFSLVFGDYSPSLEIRRMNKSGELGNIVTTINLSNYSDLKAGRLQGFGLN